MKFVEEWSENDKIVIFDEIGKGIYILTWEVPIYDQYEKFSMDLYLVSFTLFRKERFVLNKMFLLFLVFRWNISLSKNLLFLKSELSPQSKNF